MTRTRPRWNIAQPDPKVVMQLAKDLGLLMPVAAALAGRGISDVRTAEEFLRTPVDRLHSPFSLPDMDRAVERLRVAKEREEKVRIYGDYDVDGITSVSLLLPLFASRGFNVDYYIPSRLDEGYGLNAGAVDRAADEGISVMVTVDCGISATREAARCRERGIDLIITDHHEPPEELPEAIAVIDPKLDHSKYPFQYLAGVGVAMKLGEAYLAAAEGSAVAEKFVEWALDTAALGTIADVAPLTDENRIIAKHGLAKMSRPSKAGLSALIEVAGLSGRQLSAQDVGFKLGPRINAAGRVSDPSLGVRLLTTGSRKTAMELARALDAENQVRQSIEADMLRQAHEMLRGFDPGQARGIVLAAEGWHHGVVGIVASRVAEAYYRPTVLISLEGDEGRGSARSIPGFNLYEAVSRCSSVLTRFGGHEQAAGLALDRDKVDEFARLFDQVCREMLTPDMIIPEIRIDALVDQEHLTLGLAEQVERLEPFGPGNPVPVFAVEGVEALDARACGADGSHLRLILRTQAGQQSAIGFGMGNLASSLLPSGHGALDVAFTVGVSTYGGRRSLELFIKDVRPSGFTG